MNANTKCLFFVSFMALASAGQTAESPKASPAFANPAFANPATPGLSVGKPAPDVVNTVDINFLQQLSLGNRAEVELGKLAPERSDVSDIDAFGKQMVHDHGASGEDLEALARTTRVELPQSLDAEHEAARAELGGLRGADFDRRYIEQQIKDHQKAVQLLVHEIGSGQHAGVRDFAAGTLPVVMDHLERARAIHDAMIDAVPRGSPTTQPLSVAAAGSEPH